MKTRWLLGGPTRRNFLKGVAAGAAAFSMSPIALRRARGQEANLENVHEVAAAKAKELAGGRDVTLKIMQPSGSLGNVKPVADRFTEATGIKIEYLEVPLGEINQKVLLEAVSKSGSFSPLGSQSREIEVAPMRSPWRATWNSTRARLTSFTARPSLISTATRSIPCANPTA